MQNKMNIEIKKIVDEKKIQKERVVLEVIADDFLGFYILFKTKETGEGKVSSKTKGTFWFPDIEIKKGDLVVLYSRAGINKARVNKDGTTTHFFYWQKKDTIWNESNDAIVLLKSSDWNYKSLLRKK